MAQIIEIVFLIFLAVVVMLSLTCEHVKRVQEFANPIFVGTLNTAICLAKFQLGFFQFKKWLNMVN